MAEMLPNPPLTRNQIELMQVDNVASGNVPGFAELGISPRPIENVLQEMLVPRANGRWLRLHAECRPRAVWYVPDAARTCPRQAAKIRSAI